MPPCSFSVLLALTSAYMRKPSKRKERFTVKMFLNINFHPSKVHYISKSLKTCLTKYILLVPAHAENLYLCLRLFRMRLGHVGI